VVEGLRENILAQRAGYVFKEIFVCNELLKEDETYNLDILLDVVLKCGITIPKYVYEAIAYRESTEGVIGVLYQKELTLGQLPEVTNPLYLIIEGVEKPGNLGAMLRTADAVGVDAVILCDMKTDIYNPNVIRSSIGTVFTNDIAIDSTGNVLSFLQKNNISTFAAHLEATQSYFDLDFKKATAIVVGAESTGLSEIWNDTTVVRLKIPMHGEIDSLNVSVAAALLLYESLRQRVK
jgi:TrmH family RNA methyltransferase